LNRSLGDRRNLKVADWNEHLMATWHLYRGPTHFSLHIKAASLKFLT
jgi:hypothetical protein